MPSPQKFLQSSPKTVDKRRKMLYNKTKSIPYGGKL